MTATATPLTPNPQPWPKLETPRLNLSIFNPNLPTDYTSILRLYNLPHIVALWGNSGKNTPADLDTSATTRIIPAHLCTKLAPGTSPPTHQWTLAYLKDTGEFIGQVGLFYVHEKPEWGDVVNIGWSFLPEFEGKGYATEAAGRVLRWAQEVLGVEIVVARVSVNNIASVRVAEKLGGKTSEQQWTDIVTTAYLSYIVTRTRAFNTTLLSYISPPNKSTTMKLAILIEILPSLTIGLLPILTAGRPLAQLIPSPTWKVSDQEVAISNAAARRLTERDVDSAVEIVPEPTWKFSEAEEALFAQLQGFNGLGGNAGEGEPSATVHLPTHNVVAMTKMKGEEDGEEVQL